MTSSSGVGGAPVTGQEADEWERGVCDLCQQEMIRTADDCWHPWHVTYACPPEDRSGPVTVPKFGRWGRPGREHFVPLTARSEPSRA